MRSISVRVDGADQAGEARRRAAALGDRFHLDEDAAGRLAIVVTEAANNLWKHASGGEIVISAGGPVDSTVEVLALDSGPGMADPRRCFQDGYSTSGSSGTGLGAIARLSDFHDLYTVPGKGTVLLARVHRKGGRPAAAAFEIGGLSVPMRGESVCGDDFGVRLSPGLADIVVIDGLGHGPLAADCAELAIAAFQESRADSPAEILREIHGALIATRGAAVAVARIGLEQRELLLSSIGNIAGFLWQEDGARHLVSHPGIVGHDVRNVREFTYGLGPNVLTLLYSDGISTHWSLDAYTGLLSHDPSVIAGVVYRDHSRRRDDATVVVIREAGR
jgi:anti-sigma regulatory factor (Ser/Thr protein kinase)